MPYNARQPENAPKTHAATSLPPIGLGKGFARGKAEKAEMLKS
jgi:hypothetical protein